jgi:hypothetical protein
MDNKELKNNTTLQSGKYTIEHVIGKLLGQIFIKKLSSQKTILIYFRLYFLCQLV